MKIDALGIRVNELEVSNTDPDLIFPISPRQMAFLLQALQSAQPDMHAPSSATPLASWLEGFEAGCRLKQSTFREPPEVPPSLPGLVWRFPSLQRQPSEQYEMDKSKGPSLASDNPVRSITKECANRVSSVSSASSCVEADKVEDTGDGVMSSPGAPGIPDDIDAALMQRVGEKTEILTGQSGVSGFSQVADPQERICAHKPNICTACSRLGG